MLARHRENDAHAQEPMLAQKEIQHVERLEAEAKKLRRWLNAHLQDRKGVRNTIRLSNRTDNESAKMATDKGVLQGATVAKIAFGEVPKFGGGCYGIILTK